MKQAIIGVDGDCGFALLGANIQEGEADFAEIDAKEPEECNRYHCSDWCAAADKAAFTALSVLRERLGATDSSNPETWITYALHSSHPRYRS